MTRAAALALALTAAGCPEPSSIVCDDGLYCPDLTICGGTGVCLVEQDQCARFDDRTPCIPEDSNRRGSCRAGACREGVELIGVTSTFPLAAPQPGVRVVVRDHPDVLAVETNPNGYFGVRDAPQDSALVLELSFPDTMPVVTRPLAVASQDVLADVIYGEIPLVFESVVDQIASLSGVTIDPARGLVSGSTFDLASGMPVAEVVVSLAADCVGPIYLGEGGMPVPDAPSTQASTGVFAFVNCRPGATELLATRSGTGCRAYDGAALGPIPMTIVADRLLFIGRVVCP